MRKFIAASCLVGATLAFSAVAYSQAQNGPPSSTSRLANYSGFGHDTESDSRAYVADYAKRQTMIAACMRDAGYRYVSTTSSVVSQGSERRNDRAAGRARDPNIDYAMSLSNEERTNYYMALYGIPDPNDESLDDNTVLSANGCAQQAADQHTGVFEGIRGIEDEYWSMRASIRTSQEAQSATSDWSACMQSEGFSIRAPEELSVETAGDVPPPGQDSHPISRSELAQAQAADRKCRSETGLEAKLNEIRIRSENAFADKHKARLDAFVDKRRSQRSR